MKMTTQHQKSVCNIRYSITKKNAFLQDHKSIFKKVKVERKLKPLRHSKEVELIFSSTPASIEKLYRNQPTRKESRQIPLEEIDQIKFITIVELKDLQKIIDKYKEPLTPKYEQLFFIDDYGDIDKSLILKEYASFASRKVTDFIYVSKITVTQYDNSSHSCELSEHDSRRTNYISIFSAKDLIPLFDRVAKFILDEIEKRRSSTEYKNTHKTNVSFENLSPYEYEKQVAQSLEQMGWETRVTKGSGDQGCDVLATRNNLVVAIQCKYWSTPIGNKAVQEINAAKSFYNADFAVVISNQTYTPAAKLLATKLKVALLHHSQLNNLLTNVIQSQRSV